mmetsp:Transcript_2049/g.3692  ORF Transcript_2049/g.3692 Transcript_2049/m.3692 type:complete len:283 (+) Transcript_2049:155-1003(+)
MKTMMMKVSKVSIKKWTKMRIKAMMIMTMNWHCRSAMMLAVALRTTSRKVAIMTTTTMMTIIIMEKRVPQSVMMKAHEHDVVHVIVVFVFIRTMKIIIMMDPCFATFPLKRRQGRNWMLDHHHHTLIQVNKFPSKWKKNIKMTTMMISETTSSVISTTSFKMVPVQRHPPSLPSFFSGVIWWRNTRRDMTAIMKQVIMLDPKVVTWWLKTRMMMTTRTNVELQNRKFPKRAFQRRGYVPDSSHPSVERASQRNLQTRKKRPSLAGVKVALATLLHLPTTVSE